MASSPAEPGEFSLVIVEVDPHNLDEAGRSLAESFRLDDQVAQQVVRSAPIVFARGLTRHEIKSLSPRLVELSKFGLEFRVTTRPTGKMPKLNWPVRPQFTAGDSGGRTPTPTFDWQDAAFVCPTCGDAFLFKRVGALALGPTPSETPPPPVNGPDTTAVLATGDGEERFNVVLPRVADPAKVDKAVELIVRYKGIGETEARELAGRPIIQIVNNVTRTDAQQVLEEFRKHRLFGRMSKGK